MTKPYCIGSDEWNGLSKLMEEIGELQIVLGTLQQTCGKLIGSEGTTDHWSGDLRAKFIEEIGDVYASLDFFLVKNFTEQDDALIEHQRITKLDRFYQWDKGVRDATAR